MTTVATDPATGNMVHITEHTAWWTMVDDAVFVTAGLTVSDRLGLTDFIDRWLPLQDWFDDMFGVRDGWSWGVVVAVVLETRRMLQAKGWRVDISPYLRGLLSQIGSVPP